MSEVRGPRSEVRGQGFAVRYSPRVERETRASDLGPRTSTVLSFPSIDDGFAQIEAERAFADDDNGWALEPLVDGAAHSAVRVIDDRAECFPRVFVVDREPLVVRPETCRIERVLLE